MQSLDSFTEQERKILNVHSNILNVTLGDLTNVHHALDKLGTATRMTDLFDIMNTKISKTNQGLMMLETLLHVQLALSVISADQFKNWITNHDGNTCFTSHCY